MGRFATGTIAGVTLQDGAGRAVRASVSDHTGAGLPFRGSVLQTADGGIRLQLIETGTRGLRFTVTIEHCPRQLFSSIMSAIDTALRSSESFAVVLSDGESPALSVQCVPAFPEWVRHERTTDGFLQNVTFNFVAIA